MDININVDAASALDLFSKMPVKADDEIKNILDSLAREIRSEAQRLAPADSGNLRRSINFEQSRRVNDNGVWQVVVGSKLDYSTYMEYGTGRNSDAPQGTPGAVKVSPRALVNWVERKLALTGRQTPEQVAFAVAKSIEKKGGLKPRRFLRNAFAQQAPKVRDFFEYALSRMLRK